MNPGENIAEQLRAANEFFDKGDYDRASILYRAALTVNPALPSAANNLSLACERLGFHDEADRAIEDALRYLPHSAFLRFRMGERMAARGRIEEAVRHFQDAIACDPASPAADLARRALGRIEPARTAPPPAYAPPPAGAVPQPEHTPIPQPTAIPAMPSAPPRPAVPAVNAVKIIEDGFGFWIKNLNIMALFIVGSLALSGGMLFLGRNMDGLRHFNFLKIWPVLVVTGPFALIAVFMLGLMFKLYVNSALDGAPPALENLFNAAASRFIPGIVVYIACVFLAMIGFVFCVLPGVVVMVILSYAPLFVILEKRAVADAMKQSLRLVQEHFGAWLAVVAVALLLNSVSGAATLIVRTWGSQTAADLIAWFFGAILGNLIGVVFIVLFRETRKASGL